jgi:hypothetical protein
VCTTRYVQRCYYQPVTCYRTQTYYEPVTTYKTSYYYEPVTSYRYSSYFDPCTCCWHQVACPQTCYRLRSQCCAVQSWVQRCCQVPVTTYQQCSYWEPVTTCCQPTCCTPPPCPQPAPVAGYAPAAPVAPVAPVAPSVTEQQAAPVPGVTEQRYPPVPGVQEYKNGNSTYERSYDPAMPPASGTLRPVPRTSAPLKPMAPAAPPPPAVRLDRIAAIDSAQVEGRVVGTGNVPQAGARILFVSANRHGPQETVTANTAGQFRVSLASGSWLVYVDGTDGKPVFHSKIDVRSSETRQVTLVSR